MPDNFVGQFNINVSGATNPTLGQNGQGVCGVNMNFDHEYIGDLSIVLTSPSGQSVTLVGPIGLFGETDFSTWNISFVPCGDAANPDPGFAAHWTNNQPWGQLGNFTGSYYPWSGCLENFNSGSVNGTWTLTVTDGQGNDQGNFYDYEIIFCDPGGISCFSCEAEAGNLNQADISACQGSPNLSLNLPASYTPPLMVAPPASDYGYTYIISGAGGVILAYEENPDLSSYDPGVYNVCGLSYLLAQFDLIPAPNGSLTMTQLTNQLNSNTPPFCGDVSNNCVGVTINSAPPDEEETVSICAPMCYQFHNQPYCQSGTYVRNLISPQGCPYTATLYLTVEQPTIRNITETICAGTCSVTPGFEDACDAGFHQETFTNAAGCDSIVRLNLVVLSVLANIVTPMDLSCNQPTQQLFGTGSSSGGGVLYTWSASNGGHIVGGTNSINVQINAPGDYQLRVCRSSGGITCCDSTAVTVISDQTPPAAPAAIAGSSSLCQGQSASYTATSVAAATSYVWTVPAGVTINSGQNTQTINVTWNSAVGGNICVASMNACGTSVPPTCLPITVTPGAIAGQPDGDAVVCAGTTKNYSIPPVSGATGYTWAVTGGTISSGQGTTAIVVNWGNTSGSVCVNATGSCATSPDSCLQVIVNSIPAAPVIIGDSISCPGLNTIYSVTPVPGASIYHWQVTNGTIDSGQGTDSIRVSWNGNAASGIVCVNASNSCGNSADTCLNVGLSTPLAGQITTNCDPTNSFYVVSFPVSGGTPPYSVMGGTITGGVFTSDQINSGTPYSFIIFDATQCSSDTISGNFNCSCSTDAGTMDLTPLSACEGDSITAIHEGDQELDGNDVGAFILHTNSGTSLGTVLAQNTTGVFGFTGAMSYETTYYVSYVAGNDVLGLPDLADPCLSVAQGQPVVFHQNPVADAGADSDTCGLSLTLQANAGPGSGSWSIISVPGSSTLNLSGAQNPNSSATASDYGVYVLSWTLNNNGCSDTDTLTLDFNESPLATNILSTCDAANENYTVSFDITGGTPTYSIDGTPAGDITGNNFVSDPIANGGVYSYNISDANGCSSPPVTGTFNCNCSSSAGTMDVGLLSACEGDSITALYLGGGNLDGNDIGAYFLHSGSSGLLGTVFAQNSTGVFGFESGMTYGVTYYVSYVVGNNLNGVPDTSDFCLSVSIGQPVIFHQNPLANAGIDLDTCGLVLTLGGNMLPNASGAWTLVSGNASDISINESINPQSTVTATAAGIYTLAWTLTQNGCVGSDSVNIQFNDSPVLADLVRTCDPANENFTVTLTLSGGTAPYSVNGTPVTGSTYTSAPFPNAQVYTFNVSDANGCSMPTVTGAFSCNCATNAGSMPSQTISVCEGLSLTVTSNNDASLDGNDITSYVLHNGAGPALGQIFAQNTTGTFTLQNGMNLGQTYYVSIVAGNPLSGFPDPLDPCFSVAAGQPVVWLQNPVPDAGEDDAVCGTSIELPAVGSGFSGLWTQVSGPGTSVFTTASDPTTLVNVSANGTYVFQWTESNGACVGSDEVNIDFNASPVVTLLEETCDGTNTEYSITFTATGGADPYSVVGLEGDFNGSEFTSDPVANGSTYLFALLDDNGCVSESVTGTKVCDCATDAGSMQTAAALFCENTPATAVWNNDGNKDSNDTVSFILHSDAGTVLGTVYATNSQPEFNFTAALQTGVTYYISAIAGNNLSGSVDVNDPCLSIAAGAPVQWKPMPGATLSGDATLCAGDGTTLSFSGTGSYPLVVNYTDGTTQSTIGIPDNQSVALNITPAATTTFLLISVRDESVPNCLTQLQDSVRVIVNQPQSAGTANEALEFCAGINLNIVLSNLITDADYGGVWSETSIAPSSPGAFDPLTGTFQTAGQASGTYTFRYLLNSAAPCPSDEESVSIIIYPEVIADAGENQAINCDQSSVTLGGSTTTSGIYQWLLNGNIVGDTKQIIVSDGGTYTLQVSNDFGCSDTDEAEVLLDNQLPEAKGVSSKEIRCYGDDNGQISVDSFTAAHEPLRYSLSGGPFQLSPLFTNLGPGTYVVTLMDANGCESSTAPIEISEPVKIIANLGLDIEAALSDSVHLKVETGVMLNELDTILWQPLFDTSATRRLDEQNFLPLKSAKIKVIVMDANGCTAADEIVIRLEKPRNVYIPNVFNPVNGLEPIVYIFGGADVEEIESFLIFDRWGNLIFERQNFQRDDPEMGWDGTYKGKLLDPAVFIYQAKIRFIDGQTILYKGDISLIR